MDFDYFLKINNTYGAKSRQESDLYALNKHVNDRFADTIDYTVVKRNGEDFELLISRDTEANTFRKKIKSRPYEPFNLGDYMEWKGQIWLVTLLDPDDKTYCSGYMCLCGVPIRWQDSNGNIIERWAYSEDYTKYSNGTTGNNTITIGDNQYGLIVPIDSETKKLKRDMRFPMDFYDSDCPDIYMLTNRKVQLNNNEYFGRGGIMTLVLSFNSFSAETDKQVTLPSGETVWICNYKEPTAKPEPDETQVLTATISGGVTLRCGRSKTWTATFIDSDGNEVTGTDFKWNVVSGFDVAQTITDNKISLKVTDDSLTEESFLLQVIVGETVLAEADITIVESV